MSILLNNILQEFRLASAYKHMSAGELAKAAEKNPWLKTVISQKGFGQTVRKAKNEEKAAKEALNTASKGFHPIKKSKAEQRLKDAQDEVHRLFDMPNYHSKDFRTMSRHELSPYERQLNWRHRAQMERDPKDIDTIDNIISTYRSHKGGNYLGLQRQSKGEMYHKAPPASLKRIEVPPKSPYGGHFTDKKTGKRYYYSAMDVAGQQGIVRKGYRKIPD